MGKEINANLGAQTILIWTYGQVSDGSRGSSVGSREPPFETKLFHFHAVFSEKSGTINK